MIAEKIKAQLAERFKAADCKLALHRFESDTVLQFTY